MYHPVYGERSNPHVSVEPEMMLSRIPPPPDGSAPWKRSRERSLEHLQFADLPTTFAPSSATEIPDSLFVCAFASWYFPSVARWVRRSDPSQILIYTDGACSNNGRENAAAGCSFILRNPGTSRNGQTIHGHVSFRLESCGPTGEYHPQTSNRAELRAVIAALEFRTWSEEGWKSIVIATDSEYVARGATEWIHTWLRNGWVADSGAPVKNYDLWEHLLKKFIELSDYNIKVSIWRIPRHLNTKADHAAKEAARKEARERYIKIIGA